MAAARFFIDQQPTGPLEVGSNALFTLSSEDAHHAAKALRIKAGETLELVMRDSWEGYRTHVISLNGPELLVRIDEILVQDENEYPVTLVFGVSKGDKNDTIVRQAVEIGADRIVPVMFERSVVRLTPEKAQAKGDRLRAKARSAAMQAHRSITPQVFDPLLFKDCGDLFSEDALVLVLWEEERELQLAAALESNLFSCAEAPVDNSVADVAVDGATKMDDITKRPLTLVVGPEGGIAHGEIERLKEFGAIPVSLGDSILRVDTANAVALGVAFSVIKAHLT